MIAPNQFTSRVLKHFRGARGGRLGRWADAQAAADAIAALPAYQVALWPDGWLLEADGSVRIRDTHEMAEARRWLQMAARNAAGRSRQVMADTEVARTMRLHGVFVPRAVIDMAGRRFKSEQVASVALSLVAGDWISERRQTLGLSAESALALQALAWSGSRHAGAPDADAARCLLQEVLAHCIEEGLVPRAHYRLGCRADDGYGLRCCQCCVQVDLNRDERARVQQMLSTALIPWNRAVIRDGRVIPVLSVHVRGQADRGGLVVGLRRGLTENGMMLLVLVATVLLIALTSVQADERRRSGTDTARHPNTSRDGGADHRVGAGSLRGTPPVRGVPVDPAVEQYWSNKCVQQRARGWGHTGDCDSPAYTGGGRDLYRRTSPQDRRGDGRYPGPSVGGYEPRRPSHPPSEAVIVVPGKRGGVRYDSGRFGPSGFSGSR